MLVQSYTCYVFLGSCLNFIKFLHKCSEKFWQCANFNAIFIFLVPEKRFAETWDYHIKPSTFLQFDIAMGCDSLSSSLYGVLLEYSTDMGKNWNPVVQECTPPKFECTGYHLQSDFMSDQHRNWTRISAYLPNGAVYVFSCCIILTYVNIYQARYFKWICPFFNLEKISHYF
jgi:hypothetical protein